MNLLQIFLLSLVQGLTEFLPVSSSGHLAIVSEFLPGIEGSLMTDVFLHLGSLLAVLVYYRKDFWQLATKHRLSVVKFAVGAIPILAIGFASRDFIELFRDNILLVAINLIWLGVIFVFEDRVVEFLRKFIGAKDFFETNSQKNPDKNHALTPSWKQIAIIGFGQTLALLRGVSRSGITYISALLAGYKKAEALKVAFLLAIPTLSALIFYPLLELEQLLNSNTNPIELIQSLVLSFIFSILAISAATKIVNKFGFRPFGAYRIILGLVLIGYLVFTNAA